MNEVNIVKSAANASKVRPCFSSSRDTGAYLTIPKANHAKATTPATHTCARTHARTQHTKITHVRQKALLMLVDDN